MENLLLISEAAQDLEQHGNSPRIKKLIFATWKTSWENDLSRINRFPLTNILQELVNTYPTPEQLRSAFFNIVNTLNKKEEYAVVAEIILARMGNLYHCQEPEPSTQIVYKAVVTVAPPDQPSPIPLAPTSYPAVEPVEELVLDTVTNVNIPREGSPRNYLNPNYDSFAVRLAVMKYSNPLRAKILLLCVIEEQATFSQGSWLKLRSRNLDELLVEVFQKFSSLEQLEHRLFATAEGLQEPEENAQAAEAIVKAMRPFYGEKATSSSSGRNQALV